MSVDVAQLLGIGGPTATAFALLGYLVNAYFNKRKDDRQGVRLERESESGIVETTAKALEIVRGQMDALRRDIVALQADKDALAARVDHLEEELDKKDATLRKYRQQYGDIA